MDNDRCDKVIQYALLEAGRQDDYAERELGPIHLLKYVYLADLAYAERNQGKTFTGAPWIFYHYGPWAAEVFKRIEPALNAIDATRHDIPSTKYDGDFLRWQKTDDRVYADLERELPHTVVSSLRRNVRKFGKDTGELLNYVYTTYPMRRAAPRAELIFFVAEPTDRDPAPAPAPALTARQQKKRRELLADAKQAIKAKLAARREARQKMSVSTPPRYDETFFRGLTFLDELGSGAPAEVEGEAEFEDDVWESDTRGEERE